MIAAFCRSRICSGIDADPLDSRQSSSAGVRPCFVCLSSGRKWRSCWVALSFNDGDWNALCSSSRRVQRARPGMQRPTSCNHFSSLPLWAEFGL